MNQLDTQTKQFSRELDKGEYFFFLHNEVVASNVTAIAEGRGELMASELQEALLVLQQRHPLLRCRVVEKIGSRPFFEQDAGQQIPLEELQCPQASWQLTVAQAASEVLPADAAPLCKVLFLRDADSWCLAFIVNHIICDGRSVVALLKECLLLLSGSSQENIEYVPGEAVESASSRTRGMLKDILNTVYYRLLAPYSLARRGETSVPHGFKIDEQSSDCRSHFFEWDETASSAFRDKCRQQQVSVSGALAGMLLKALRSEVAGEGQVQLGITTTVDLRNRLTPAIDAHRLQLYAGSVLTTVPVSEDENLWETAKHVQKDVKTKVERNIGCDWWRWFPTSLANPPYEDARDRFLRETCSHSYQSPTFSNIGVIDDCREIEAFDLQRIYMFANPMLNGPYILLAGSFRGRLWLNLCANCVKLPAEVLQRTAQNLQQQIDSL